MYDKKSDGTYTQSIDGAYYHNTTDGTYDDEIKSGATYEQSYLVYTASDDGSTTVVTPTAVSYEGTVGTNGVLEINGLGAGEYTITEIKAPTGYNLLNKAIKMTIEFNAPSEAADGCEWTYSPDFQDGAQVDIKPTNTATGTYDLKVENNMGSTLPSTGGIGTRIFYGVGSVLLIGAAVLLITKKRMSVEND
jgi:LPXTG-motif cell wall-anchored protein